MVRITPVVNCHWQDLYWTAANLLTRDSYGHYLYKQTPSGDVCSTISSQNITTAPSITITLCELNVATIILCYFFCKYNTDSRLSIHPTNSGVGNPYMHQMKPSRFLLANVFTMGLKIYKYVLNIIKRNIWEVENQNLILNSIISIAKQKFKLNALSGLRPLASKAHFCFILAHWHQYAGMLTWIITWLAKYLGGYCRIYVVSGAFKMLSIHVINCYSIV